MTSVREGNPGLIYLCRELLGYLERLVDNKTARPGRDVISTLVMEQLKPGHLEKLDVVQVVFLLLVAGNATVVSMIALVCLNGPEPGKLRRLELMYQLSRVW